MTNTENTRKSQNPEEVCDTAKWHGAGSKMDDGVVDAAAAEVTQIQYFFLRFFVFTEEI